MANETGGAAGGTGTGGDGTGNPASGGAAAGGDAGVAAPWHGLTDPTAVEYVKNKGWTASPDVIKSYMGAEKLIGRDPSTLLVMPRADDPVGTRAVFSKLGMPETADKYEIAVPEGADPTYGNWAKETFHKIGLTGSQAKALSAANNEYIKNATVEATKNYERQVTTDKAALLGEWRGGFERMMAAAQTARQQLGFTGEMVDALEQALGYAGTMKFFAGLGQKMGEAPFIGGGDKGGGFGATQTPAEAAADWATMKADPAQLKALQDPSHPGHEEAKRKQNNLFKIMYPE